MDAMDRFGCQSQLHRGVSQPETVLGGSDVCLISLRKIGNKQPWLANLHVYPKVFSLVELCSSYIKHFVLHFLIIIKSIQNSGVGHSNRFKHSKIKTFSSSQVLGPTKLRCRSCYVVYLNVSTEYPRCRLISFLPINVASTQLESSKFFYNPELK